MYSGRVATLYTKNASIAQLAVRSISNQQVKGSTPFGSPKMPYWCNGSTPALQADGEGSSPLYGSIKLTLYKNEMFGVKYHIWLYGLTVRMSDCRSEGEGSIPFRVATVFQ